MKRDNLSQHELKEKSLIFHLAYKEISCVDNLFARLNYHKNLKKSSVGLLHLCKVCPLLQITTYSCSLVLNTMHIHCKFLNNSIYHSIRCNNELEMRLID